MLRMVPLIEPFSQQKDFGRLQNGKVFLNFIDIPFHTQENEEVLMDRKPFSWQKMMHNWKVYLFLPLLLGSLAGCKGRSAEAQEVPDDSPTSIPVRVLKPKLGGLERKTVQPATVQAFEFVMKYAQVSGVLAKQKVDIGSKVKKGDLLAEIVAPELIQEQAHAAAALEQAKEQVKQAKKRVQTATADLKATEKMVEQREKEMDSYVAYQKYRKAELERYKELVASEVIDRRVFDEEQDRYEAAKSRADAAIVAVETAKLDVLTKAAKLEQVLVDVDLARAYVRVAKATLGKADVFVNFTKIIADFDGVITKRNYNNGDFIRTADRAGQLPLLVLQVRNRMRVIVQIPDTDAPYVNEGNPAVLRIAALGKKGKFKGTVSRLSYMEDEKSRTMQVEVDLDNPKHLLRHGMFGEITIRLQGTPEKAFTLPASCLKRDSVDEPYYVFVVRNDGKAHKVEVRVGFDNAARAEILDGLDQRDLVVADPHGALSDGCKVLVINPDGR
jgi:RND family efflux transporter MFP subunit